MFIANQQLTKSLYINNADDTKMRNVFVGSPHTIYSYSSFYSLLVTFDVSIAYAVQYIIHSWIPFVVSFHLSLCCILRQCLWLYRSFTPLLMLPPQGDIVESKERSLNYSSPGESNGHRGSSAVPAKNKVENELDAKWKMNYVPTPYNIEQVSLKIVRGVKLVE